MRFRARSVAVHFQWYQVRQASQATHFCLSESVVSSVHAGQLLDSSFGGSGEFECEDRVSVAGFVRADRRLITESVWHVMSLLPGPTLILPPPSNSSRPLYNVFLP